MRLICISTQLAKMSFDEIIDLTPDVFKFYKYCIYLRTSPGGIRTEMRRDNKADEARGCEPCVNTIQKPQTPRKAVFRALRVKHGSV